MGKRGHKTHLEQVDYKVQYNLLNSQVSLRVREITIL
jgi:hypothetical protein